MYALSFYHIRESTSHTNVMQEDESITLVKDTIADRLKEARGAIGLSQPELAKKAGVVPGTIGNIESGARKSPRELLAIAKALGVRAEWLKDGTEPRHPAEAVLAGRPRITRRTPVVGTAKLGDDGYYEELEHPTGDGDGWVEGHTTDPEAYALRVKGDSMHPAIRHGWFVVVAPNGRCTPGEYVAIALTNGKKMVKELVIERADEVVIESVNGNLRQTISRSDIEKMHPVAAVVSPSQWKPA